MTEVGEREKERKGEGREMKSWESGRQGSESRTEGEVKKGEWQKGRGGESGRWRTGKGERKRVKN
jgi:hypothetical protein